MKILLVGEYSRLHNSLKEGLLALGHHVTLISTGDFFKKYPSDIILDRKFDQGFGKKIKVGIFKLTGIDITSISLKKQFFKHSKQLKDYDIVQLINESPFTIAAKIEMELISFLKEHNKKLFLLSCGTDYLSVKYALADKAPKNLLKEYKDGNASAKSFQYALKYIEPAHKALHEHLLSLASGVIASDMDYHIPLVGQPKYLGIVPNPVNISKLDILDNPVAGPVRIFLGINRGNYHAKGIRYFEEALDYIQQEYPNKVSVEIVENLPYDQYVNSYNKAHIILDQALAHDQGYNALEAMAKGKVVFTGAETSFKAHYSLEAVVAINTTPNVPKIIEDLEHLILNPDQIKIIGDRAANFVRSHHDHIKVAQQYLKLWQAH